MPSYQEFKNQVLGKAYDIDGYYGAQCWDGYAKYAQYLGQPICHCTSSGYVKDIWNLRGSNGILNYNSEVNILQAGDIVVFRECSATPLSHIAIFDSDAGGGYGNFLGQNQGAAGGAFNIVRLPYSATFDTAFRPNQFAENALDHLQAETGVATLTYDNIQARLNSPTGSVVRKYMAGDQITYAWKYVGNGHRYIVWKEGDNYIFLAVSNSETQGVEPWATFAPVEQDIGYDDSKLIKENGVAHFTHDNIIIRKGTPDGEDTGKRFMAGQSQEYTEKWIGNGHRYISWVETEPNSNKYRYFVAVSAGEDYNSERWATISAKETSAPKPKPQPPKVEPTNKIDTSNVKHWGVDISELNDDVNLSKYDFAIIRACYGEYTDKKLAQWVNECNRLGIPFGLYCYDYALNDDQALAEAKYILKLAEQYQPTLGIWFDMEDADNYKKKNGVLTAERCLKSCQIFCKAVKDAGWYTGVYSSTWWFDNWLTSGLDDYDKWVAQWDANDGDYHSDTSSMGTIHQYTSVDKHSGIGLDKNAMYVDFDHYKVKVDKPSEEKPSEPQKEPTDDKKELSGMLKTLIGLLKKLLSVFGKSGD